MLDEIDISSLALRERAKRISYLPANPFMAWPISVIEAVSLGRYPHSRGIKPIKTKRASSLCHINRTWPGPSEGKISQHTFKRRANASTSFKAFRN